MAAAVSGCRPGTALHSRYNNFRAYYNTYYNATRSLEEGEETLQTATTRVDLSRLVELFPSGGGTATGSRSPAFQAAIDKSAELLRGRASSAWADDALLVIGKAYYYQRNFVGAEQKFRETMAAATLREDRRLADEARFWLGRTLASAGRYDEGVGVLQDGLAEEGGTRRWRARMALALAELYAWAGRWDEAAPALRDGLPAISDADLAARGYLLLGQVEEAAGRFEAAADAYAAAVDRRPAYEISYAAMLSEALVLGLDAGRTDDALARLRAMRRDDKHYARRAEVALAQARVLGRAGDADAAEALFRDVLYDETLAGQTIRGAAHARLAEFYRDVREDYVRAAAHFDTAATALPAELTDADRPSREALLGVGRQATTFGDVAATSRRLTEIDSLMALGALDDEAFAARIAAIEAERFRTWEEEQRRLAAVRAAQDFGGTVAASFGEGDPGPPGATTGAEPPPGSAAPGGLPGPSGADAGFLSFRDAASLQNGLVSFQRIWGDRPLVPEWRRLAAIQAAGVASGVGGGPSGTDARGLASTGPAPLDLSVVPRTPEQRALLVSERAGLRYELGNAFFLALARTDLARAAYQQVIDDAPGTPVGARALYALAELEAAEGNAALAADLYARAAAADTTGVIGRAAQARAEGREPEADRPVTSEADAAYAEARRLWTAGDPLAAAHVLVRQGDADPEAPGAARAFFAAAAAYAEWAGGDSLRLAAAMPDSLAPVALLAVAPTVAPPAPLPVPEAPAVEAPVPTEPLDPLDRGRPPGVPAPVGEPSLVVPSDSTAAPEAVESDSALVGDPPVVPDTSVVFPEAPGGNSETMREPGDLPVGLDTQAVTPDSLAVSAGLGSTAADPGFTLDDYLAAFAIRYPESPYTASARALREVLTGGPPAPEPADGIGDEGELVDEEPVAPPVAVDDPGGLRGRTPPDPALGGVTWKIQTFAGADEAEAVATSLRSSRLRVAVLTDGSLFYVVAGQFPSAAEGEAVRDQLPSWAQTRSVLIPIGGFTIAGAPPAPSPAGTPGGEPEDG